MTMSRFKPAFLCIGIFCFLELGCGAGSGSTPVLALQQHPAVQTDTTGGKVLTIVKVQKPWYAFRFLIVSRFKGSVPDYARIPGLLHKAYCLPEHHNSFGGIYLWQSKPDEDRWFNAAWFARVKKEYGEGTVDTYQVTCVHEVSSSAGTEGDFWSALSFIDGAAEHRIDSLVRSGAAGLLRAVEVQDSAGRCGVVTLWNTERNAKAYFETYPATTTYFDTPVLINNAAPVAVKPSSN